VRRTGRLCVCFSRHDRNNQHCIDTIGSRGLEAPTTCTTPCAVVAKRSADITVTIAKEGYEPQVIPLTKDISTNGGAGFAGNILLGGVVGMGVDAATGAALDHKPNPVIVTLQPNKPPPPPPRAVKPRKKPAPTS
jgi:hypothetical protein